MRSTTKTWPHPDTLVSISDVADLLDVSRTTLAKPIAKLRKGEPPGSRIEAIVIAANIFAAHSQGATPKVRAGLLIDQLNPQYVAKSPSNEVSASSEVRYRLSKKEKAQLHQLPPLELYGIFAKTYERVATRNNPNARRLLEVVIDALMANQCHLPMAIVDCVKTERFRAFATLSDWMEKAAPEDFRLFVLFKERGRPIDYFQVPEKRLRHAKHVFLRLPEWLDAMKVAVSDEAEKPDDIKQASTDSNSMIQCPICAHRRP